MVFHFFPLLPRLKDGASLPPECHADTTRKPPVPDSGGGREERELHSGAKQGRGDDAETRFALTPKTPLAALVYAILHSTSASRPAN